MSKYNFIFVPEIQVKDIPVVVLVVNLDMHWMARLHLFSFLTVSKHPIELLKKKMQYEMSNKLTDFFQILMKNTYV